MYYLPGSPGMCRQCKYQDTCLSLSLSWFPKIICCLRSQHGRPNITDVLDGNFCLRFIFSAQGWLPSLYRYFIFVLITADSSINLFVFFFLKVDASYCLSVMYGTKYDTITKKNFIIVRTAATDLLVIAGWWSCTIIAHPIVRIRITVIIGVSSHHRLHFSVFQLFIVRVKPSSIPVDPP